MGPNIADRILTSVNPIGPLKTCLVLSTAPLLPKKISYTAKNLIYIYNNLEPFGVCMKLQADEALPRLCHPVNRLGRGVPYRAGWERFRRRRKKKRGRSDLHFPNKRITGRKKSSENRNRPPFLLFSCYCFLVEQRRQDLIVIYTYDICALLLIYIYLCVVVYVCYPYSIIVCVGKQDLDRAHVCHDRVEETT